MAGGLEHESTGRKLLPALYVVATPIGNLQDITLRALDVLKRVHAIAAEDTRVTAKVLDHYAISPPKMIALHGHNEERAAQRVIAELHAGYSVALTSDAGTPAFSDPGARLVAAAREGGIAVVPIPGANAVATALSASGFAQPQFVFLGFLPAKPAERRAALERVKTLPYLLVMYEAPHRVLETIADLAAVLGSSRKAVIARELTKLFENIHVCEVGAASEWMAADPKRAKGEFVLIVEGAKEEREGTLAEARRTLEVLLETLPVKQAAQLAARLTGARRNALYDLALQLKRASDT